MQSFILIISTVYGISFLPIAAFIYTQNKKESEKEKMGLFLLLFVAGLIALAPTAVIAVFLFALLGSANVLDTLFSLGFSRNQLITLTIFILVYLFTIDSVIEKLVEYITGKNKITFFLVLLSRIFAFHMIGLIIGVQQANSFIIAVGVALIIMLLEILYLYREKQSAK
ncbi:hypothetical protein ACM26V_15375 [Salipaludibacillus sp. HK11]|uniref:hypothetical protein n=1 Tax=Salipaludibacillus sp. HK11 TaxID=3394320 RepID=UPI0039FCB315